ncbi:MULTISPECIES: hypothetical protein [Methylococcus]|uniref:Uncharacterized protein n=1 Tax=Methylococcus capsulatus TaxID=414 RepID=A0ABZ2F4M0_METCP|nr:MULTISPECIES: hypothetical protein [Methylococcus]MDF9392560.1 hypothetical protein [Methylococcus capsulatus]
MSNELLLSIGGLFISVLTYFAGVQRTEAHHRMKDRGVRIDRVINVYLEFDTKHKASGLDGLLKSGIATLETDAEIREVGRSVRAHGKQNPLSLESGILDNVNLKKFFDYAARESVNFYITEVSDVVEKSGA